MDILNEDEVKFMNNSGQLGMRINYDYNICNCSDEYTMLHVQMPKMVINHLTNVDCSLNHSQDILNNDTFLDDVIYLLSEKYPSIDTYVIIEKEENIYKDKSESDEDENENEKEKEEIEKEKKIYDYVIVPLNVMHYEYSYTKNKDTYLRTICNHKNYKIQKHKDYKILEVIDHELDSYASLGNDEN